MSTQLANYIMGSVMILAGGACVLESIVHFRRRDQVKEYILFLLFGCGVIAASVINLIR